MRGLSVLTQNVWGGGPGWRLRRPLVARQLTALAPDIAALQEVMAPRIDAPSQAHELADALARSGLRYHVDFAPGRVWDDGRCEGVAILCREGIRERSVESLSLDINDRWEGQSQRVVLCAMLDLPIGPVDVFATHLSLSRTARARTMNEVLAFTRRERGRSKSRAAILLGDLNASANEDAILNLQREWTDLASLRTRSRRVDLLTWPAVCPVRRLDYAFVQPANAFRVVGWRRHFSGSDHLGVSAHLAPDVGLAS